MRGVVRARERGGIDPEVQDGVSPLRAMRRLVAMLLTSRAPGLSWRIASAAGLTLAGKGLNVWSPLLLGAAVNLLSDPVRRDGALQAFLGLAAAWAFIRFLSSATPQIRDAIFQPVSLAARRRAASEAFAHALNLSLDFHQSKRTGALSRTIDRGAGAVDFLTRVLIFNLGPTVLELALAAAVLWSRYDWRFAAAAVVTIGAYGVLTFAISDWRIRHRRALNEADSEAAGRAVDALLNYETVKTFGAEARAAKGYEEALSRYADASVKATTSLSLLNVVQGAVMSLGLAAMAVLAGMEVIAGRMGPGDVAAVTLLLISLYQPLNILGFAYREIRQAFIDLEAMDALRREVPDIVETPGARELGVCGPKGAELRFDAVSFSHGARSHGLDRVDFVAAPGATVAVVGPSGAGKTTLARLALRMLDPQSGAVSLDGIDLRALSLRSLREAVALVPQDVALFNDSLRANIAFGRPEASLEEIESAAAAAELSAFIASLPEGLQTRVGERGLKLSGGERQRVGLARAMLTQPRLLILDEATSALDGATEAAIQSTLRRARRGRTTLVVAHRLSTIADADLILVLKGGRIVERGDHATLIARGGEYARLWRRQIRDGGVEAPGDPALAPAGPDFAS